MKEEREREIKRVGQRDRARDREGVCSLTLVGYLKALPAAESEFH